MKIIAIIPSLDMVAKNTLSTQGNFDSHEYERSALPNLKRWLTTSSHVIGCCRTLKSDSVTNQPHC